MIFPVVEVWVQPYLGACTRWCDCGTGNGTPGSAAPCLDCWAMPFSCLMNGTKPYLQVLTLCAAPLTHILLQGRLADRQQ